MTSRLAPLGLLLMGWVFFSPVNGAAPAEEATRRWTDTTGRFSVEARLLQHSATHVQLGTTDGRKIAVPMAQLSQADHDYLNSLQSAPAAESMAANKSGSLNGRTRPSSHD